MNITKLLNSTDISIKELSTEEMNALKAVFIEMFKDIYAACKKHGLNVMLSGGSCLGAIRHNGFIPWDDDMDIMLMRKDYNQLPQVLVQEYGNKYQCVGPNISSHTDLSFMRIEKPGTTLRCIYDNPEENKPVFIDVFPVDNMPNSKITRYFNSIIADGIHYIALCMKYYDHRNCPMVQCLRETPKGRREIGLRLSIGKFFSKFTSYTELFGWLDRFFAKYSDVDTKEVGVPCSRRYLKEIYPRNVFLPITRHSFEDIPDAPIPNNFDLYLRTLYGDYMQLPPIDQRKHAFWTDLKI